MNNKILYKVGRLNNVEAFEVLHVLDQNLIWVRKKSLDKAESPVLLACVDQCSDTVQGAWELRRQWAAKNLVHIQNSIKAEKLRLAVVKKNLDYYTRMVLESSQTIVENETKSPRVPGLD